MNGRTNSSFKVTIEALTRELDARENQKRIGIDVPTPNPAYRFFSTREIRRKIQELTYKSKKHTRGNWYKDKRIDLDKVRNKRVLRNARSVTLICKEHGLIYVGNGNWELKVKGFGEKYYLSKRERFFHQPVPSVLMCSGVLVAADVVATAAHFITNKSKLNKLVFLFNYRIEADGKVRTRIPGEKVYRGAKILYRIHDVDGPGATGADVVLVRLDREVQGQEIAKLASEPLRKGQALYGLGHPSGLPAKCAPGGIVKHIEKAFFTTELDMYSGNSGSPIFCRQSHDLLGIVADTDPKDFVWDDDCGGYVPVVYPNKEIKSGAVRAIGISTFSEYIDRR